MKNLALPFLSLVMCIIICGCTKEYSAMGFADYSNMRASIIVKGNSISMYGSATNTHGLSWSGSAYYEKNGDVYSFPNGFFINEVSSTSSYGAFDSYSYSEDMCYAEITEIIDNGNELEVRGIKKGYMPIYDKPFSSTFHK